MSPNNSLTKAATETRVRVHGWKNTAIRSIATRARKADHDDRGQTALEYLGIILVVVLIIGAIAGSGIGGAILARIMEAISSINGT